MRTIALVLVVALSACDNRPPTSDEKQTAEQERILQEGAAQVGMPAIKNHREQKLLKDILEMRDQEGLVTWTYTYNEYTGKPVFFCDSIGYGIPYATQFTSPQKVWKTGSCAGSCYHTEVVPQADPNGLFAPVSAEGTWVMCKNPNGDGIRPVYVEPKVISSPWPLPQAEIPKTPLPEYKLEVKSSK